MQPFTLHDARTDAGLIRLALTLRFARLYVEARARDELSALGVGGGFDLDLEGLELLLAGRDTEGAANLLAEDSLFEARSLDHARLRLLALRVALADAIAGGAAGPAQDGAESREEAMLAARLLIGRAAELAAIGYGEGAAFHPHR